MPAVPNLKFPKAQKEEHPHNMSESNPQTISKWQPQSYFEDEQEASLFDDFKTVFKLAVPPIISMFFQFFVQLINTYYIGHLNN